MATNSIPHATAKIQQHFAAVVQTGDAFRATRGGYAIEFLRNGRGDSFTCLRVRRVTEQDDPQTDYAAGMWCRSVKHAIEHALRNIAQDADDQATTTTHEVTGDRTAPNRAHPEPGGRFPSLDQARAFVAAQIAKWPAAEWTTSEQFG